VSKGEDIVPLCHTCFKRRLSEELKVFFATIPDAAEREQYDYLVLEKERRRSME
jgi:hypothetical protein